MRPGTYDQAVRTAYDAVAPEYDRQLVDDVWMRQILWMQYSRAFRPGHHVLDVGCGTGTDAVFLAQRGVRVTAIDISPAMIAQTESKVARYGVTAQVRVVLLDIGDLVSLPAGEFNGIISSFAALNTLPALTQFAVDAARILQPNSRMILHLLNGSSLWEWIVLIAHGKWSEAWQLRRRRQRVLGVGGQPVPHYMPRAEEAYALDFAPHFRLYRARGLGITRPPYPIGRVPEPLLAQLSRLDWFIGSHHPFTDWGRFVVLEMVKDSKETSSDLRFRR